MRPTIPFPLRPPTALLLLLLLLLLAVIPRAPLAPRACAEEDPVERRKRDLLFRLHVHRAIDRGAVWLAEQQKPDGSFEIEEEAGATMPGPATRYELGECALATYTLAHCGYTPERTEIRRAVAYLRKHYRAAMRGAPYEMASSYSLSLVVLALHTLYAEPPEALGEDDARRYGSSLGSKRNPCNYPGWARAMIEDILDWLLEHRAEKGLFRYPGGLPAGPPGGPGGPPGGGGPPGFPPGAADFLGDEDLSNTQYVLLALWAGTRCGYEIDSETVVAMAHRLLAWQERDGPETRRRLDPAEGGEAETRTVEAAGRDRARGFGYTPGEAPTGSMTTAGLSSLAVLKAVLLEAEALDVPLRLRLDAGMWDAIAWFDRNFSVRENPRQGPQWHYYYLYGLERACVLVAKTHLAGMDWYRAGAELLVAAQGEDGRWSARAGMRGRMPPGGPGTSMDLTDTCFALLFLRRAALPPQEPLLPAPTVTPTPR